MSVPTGRPKPCLKLTAEEREELNGFAGSRSLPHALVSRAKLVLWSGDGLSNTEIAERLDWTKATAEGTSGNSFYGLAIGSTVLIGAFAVGNISGGVFNPAVALGISVMGLSAWGNMCVYLIAELLGGALAAVVFRLLTPARNEKFLQTRQRELTQEQVKAA